ncbi:oligopeptide/dipeptide ABC transporter ATP-binding protein [Conexibacter woesei]|uniref:Oligopeptide/dipeptide ABC transporter, ATPase subunit n=1 Tax=Conexibacter woesei (strain DSM 14684 / CCUG 47730 / CIP 108061 / JCM 11494 / NBRC 100937 / ID131577) TaxID=469383 RepID=D3FEK8_CONWI|nr:oligopeptide/dipeptide ABC transporter ATP-binding protein [Conexibacter woesei]ADB49682.1 oligopeptide/dipeptide ABC transporter, ATPase subunit [Conexibacter woesei DSM 14684]
MSTLRVDEVVKEYPLRGGGLRGRGGAGRATSLRAVAGVSFAVAEGTTFGLVGESGCGKSTLSRIVLGLDAPTAGHVEACGEDPATLGRAALKAWRRKVQIVAQDPAGALPARMRVGRIVEEPWRVHGVTPEGGRADRAAELLAQVGLPRRHAGAFPHELSGGQRQRVVIARALALEPRLVVCDEPVSALDVSVQAQVLELLRGLQADRGLTYLFISHDLGVVKHMADEIGVMYRGAMVERGAAAEVYARPRHPYTRELLDAIPSIRRAGRRRSAAPVPAAAAAQEAEAPGAPLAPGAAAPQPDAAEQGCPYRGRCALAVERCAVEAPQPREIEPGRWSACHRAEEVA